MKIKTDKEVYYINKKQIKYINIYEDNAGLITIDIRLKGNENILIDEQETGINEMKKIIEMIEISM